MAITTKQQCVGEWQFIAQPEFRLSSSQRNNGPQFDSRTLSNTIPSPVKHNGFITPLPGDATGSGSGYRLFSTEPLRRVTGNVKSEYLHHSLHLAAPLSSADFENSDAVIIDWYARQGLNLQPPAS